MSQSHKDALQNLLAKVEAGEWPDQLFSGTVIGYHNDSLIMDAFNGSLDAAKELHNAVLHERVVVKWNWSNQYGGVFVLVLDGKPIAAGAATDNPARAWLCAILKSLTEECDA